MIKLIIYNSEGKKDNTLTFKNEIELNKFITDYISETIKEGKLIFSINWEVMKYK